MQIVPYAENRRAELFALLRACLGEKETIKRDERFWAWKHERNPFGPSLLLFGEEDGQLVGLRAFLRWQWQTGGRQVAAVRAVDTATHPNHQRKGIFTTLTMAGLEAAKAEKSTFVFNTPNRSSMPGYLKMGWQQVARLPMQVKVLRPLRFAGGLLRTRLMGGDRRSPVGEKVFRQRPRPVAEFLDEQNPLEELLARDSVLRGPALTTVRSREFLRWRYAEHPYVSYYVETAASAGRLQGALIWRTDRRFGLIEVKLCDLLLADGAPGVTGELVSGLRKKVRADYLIAHFGPLSAHRDALRHLGFVTIPGQGMDFTVRPLGQPVLPDPLSATNWSLSLGDLEIF